MDTVLPILRLLLATGVLTKQQLTQHIDVLIDGISHPGKDPQGAKCGIRLPNGRVAFGRGSDLAEARRQLRKTVREHIKDLLE